ncbi:hypothetical protein FRX31_024463 [Thalictrum thalictroides]|uniref:Uncharacterized protein n=1 Tax=Thalictrum thalictroides TaxID=46969 RepID=A0A7J6VP61_THATH|nr:hypothetical protein FRX31_024463 [Thalictrum thalictroides]
MNFSFQGLTKHVTLEPGEDKRCMTPSCQAVRDIGHACSSIMSENSSLEVSVESPSMRWWDLDSNVVLFIFLRGGRSLEKAKQKVI